MQDGQRQRARRSPRSIGVNALQERRFLENGGHAPDYPAMLA